MRFITLYFMAFISLNSIAQVEKGVVLEALQDAKYLIANAKYIEARLRLKDVEDFSLYKDSIAYFLDKIDLLEGKYDREGELTEGMKFVIRKGKCGYVNAIGKEIVPIKYDYEKGVIKDGRYVKNTNEEYVERWYRSYPLVRIKLNGKYGFVNRMGREIFPPKYDETNNTYFWNRLRVMEVRLGDKYGLINSEGEEIVPCIYQDAKGEYMSENTPSVVKKNGKYAYVDKKGELLTDFQYDSADNFFGHGISKKLAVVCKDGRYGYVNEKCQEVIPLQYQSAKEFREGLAVVVQNNKVGFINEEGVIVIPFLYDDEVWGHVDFGNAVLKKNGKWGIIDKQGENITEFKYDRVKRIDSGGDYDMVCGEKVLYVDIMGHEYLTEDERSSQSSKTLLEAAEKGNSEAQWYVSWNCNERNGKYPQDLKKSYYWCVKAANAGVHQAWEALGEKYYYGKGREKDYDEAFKWFRKAADRGFRVSNYFLGWMYEHGQGTAPNRVFAIKYYKRAALLGNEDAMKRLRSLNINVEELTIGDYTL